MERFRKEANLSGAVNAAELAGKTIQRLGKKTWGAAKFLGGGADEAIRFGEHALPVTHKQVRGAGVLAGTGYAASQAPHLARKAKKDKDEAMTPWRGQKVYL